MFNLKRQLLSIIFILLISSSSIFISASTTKSVQSTYEWGSLHMGGGGFVSGLVRGQTEMYLRTDVGGAYKYDYTNKKWVQLFNFIDESQSGLLSVRGIAIDPTDDNIVYFLCGCAYLSDGKTVIFKTTNGGKTFKEIDVTSLIQVNGNGDGRVCSEQIAVNPDNPNMIYAGGDVASGDSALIKSTDGGLTWSAVIGYNNLGLFKYKLNWPSWSNHIVRGTTYEGYVQQGGINCIRIYNGKVYVATSVKGYSNIHYADVSKDSFSVLSYNLPTNNYPLTLTDDSNGNLFITYISGLNFEGESGGAYKYNINSKTVTNISPTDKAIGMIAVDKSNPNKLVTRTTGVWQSQSWGSYEAWGDSFYRSTDGGNSWTNITPGQSISLSMKNNGYEWISGKSIHWGAGIVIDPRDSNKIYMLSGNGIFACDNVWASYGIQFYFVPKGVEETVPLDMVSVKGGYAYSAILDYDGFIHKSLTDIGIQYTPNIGSTGVIAVCTSDTNIMMRISYNDNTAYYSNDAGTSWTKMNSAGGEGAGKGAITKYNGKYRFLHALSGSIVYSDNYGQSWNYASGVKGGNIGILVDENYSNYVYYYSRGNYNEYTYFGVSKDGGKTFTTKNVCVNDGSNFSNRISFVETGSFIVSGGYNGAYLISNYGTTITKLDVSYSKTIGTGVPKKSGKPNAIYMYGKVDSTDPEGIFRSEDKGSSWVLINSLKTHGGPGNGNFIVGDKNTFGTLYMSTVGLGVLYGKVK